MGDVPLDSRNQDVGWIWLYGTKSGGAAEAARGEWPVRVPAVETPGDERARARRTYYTWRV